MMQRFKFYSIALLLGCSAVSLAAPPTGAPDLCEIDGGRYCLDCSAGGCEPGQGESGWLCCVGGWCVPQSPGGDCLGVSGWCNDYTIKTTKAGSEYAVCEDSQ